jgi:energy-coupling factor transport system ATP-binding protein
MNEYIKTEDLYFSYDNEDNETIKLALDDINLTINKGEFVAILGHNGSGKSTLAKHFNAILLPSGGTVYVDGVDTKNAELLYSIRKDVGMVFQNPDNQIVATIVEEDVAFAPENLGVPREEIRIRVDEALQTVGMYEYRLHAPHQLSGGQKQRVAIAGVIAMKPRCIVLDEPTAMLDPQGRREVIKTINKLNIEFGITVVLITHYMDEAVKAKRVIVMEDGKIIIDDTPGKVFMQIDRLRKLSLDVPQATELANILKNNGFDMPDEVLTADDCVEAISKLLDNVK